ncbi:hypothetical protein [Cohnella zeiphila]|uniref:Uncharacterized protein n=1 Tax=Cohnella zeiphila TaxID=2761120 RepID=A0A7X0SLZ1_9BACL|nr:hypothetical protein [Cohnella zeiphila]MBB6732334.1 hypothetical protein [Cohnella zeiphila]
MRKYRLPASIILLLFISIIVWMWVQNTRPIYRQIEASLKDIDSSYRQVLHVDMDMDMDRKNPLVFYLTNKEEIAVVILRKSLTGFKLRQDIGKTAFSANQDISWSGTERQAEGIHLLYGRVKNPETTQIIIVSEGNEPATMINSGPYTMWYFLAKGNLQNPITLRTFDKNGKKLYETGDPPFWNAELDE